MIGPVRSDDDIIGCIGRNPGISTVRLGMILDMDPVTTADVCNDLHRRGDLERRTDRITGTVSWYVPEYPRGRP